MLHFGRGNKDNRRLRRVRRKKRELRYDPKSRIDYFTSDEYIQDVMAPFDESESEYEPDERQLQDPDLSMQIGNWEQCVFRNNSQGPVREDFVEYGIVTAIRGQNTMVFEDCLFYDNHFGDPSIAQEGYAIRSKSSPIEIRNTCFVNNEFMGMGVVQAVDDAAYEFENVHGVNNGDGMDDLLHCQFLASSPVTPQDPTNVTCVEYDSTVCTSTLTMPNPPPSMTLSEVPTPTPATSDSAGSLCSLTSAAAAILWSLLL
jgi:hypothetical protein